jgi:5-hydroxyisourate hydrolase-like protein (transthyretin family)
MVGGLSSGTYRLRFDESEGNYVTQYYDGTNELENATDISVTAGQSTTAIDSQLAKAAQMKGTVTDASANPLRGTHVEVYQYDQEEESWQSIAMNTTNFYGHYEVRGLNAGSYRVGFFDDDYLPQYYDGAGTLESATDVEITAAQTSEGRDASLEMGATIEGTFTTADGQPVKDIWVQLYRNDDNGEWQAIGGDKSNTSGHYAVTGLLSDSYRIAFVDWAAHYATQYYPDATSLSNASDISVTSGETLSDIDSTLAEGGKISGALTTQLGEPVADIEAQAYRQEGNEWQKAGVSTTDSDGAYNLSGLSGGSYRIGFIDPFNRYPTQYYPNASQLSDATDIALTMGQSSSEINSALAEATEALAQATSESGSMIVQPETGEITVVQRQTNRTDVTISQSVTCPDDATPSKVQLLLNETIYNMSFTDKYNDYTATIPAEALLDGAEIKRQKTCQSEVQEEAIGQIQLFEPIGRIIDATTAQPLAGVTVALYHLPGWQARSSPSQDAANTCQSQRSKGDNQPWNQPAPTHLGTLATTDTISSTQNPIVTDADGYYGWNLSAGCWYVTTDAEAYDKLTSPLVGLPSDLTDLNLLLKRSERSIYLPLMSYQRAD